MLTSGGAIVGEEKEKKMLVIQVSEVIRTANTDSTFFITVFVLGCDQKGQLDFY